MIGVICARNPGRRNLGMYSVDLSAESYFSQLGHAYELLTHTGHRHVGGLNFKVVGYDVSYLNYDDIVFWGDFQQNPIWGIKNFAPRFAKDRKLSPEAALNVWQKLLLLRDLQTKSGQKFYSVGTCFLGAIKALEQIGLGPEEYKNALQRFTAILPRDDVSYRELSDLGLTNIIQGFDCASLIEHSPVIPRNYGRFAFAFGRTIRPETAKQVVRTIAHTLGLEAIPVSWLLSRYRLKRLPHLYNKAIETFRSCDFVVTDIYHMTLNAMNSGSLVYCLGRDEATFTDTCDDYKKSVLMEMVGRDDLYISIPNEMAESAEFISNAIVGKVRAGKPPESRFCERQMDFRNALGRLWAT